MDKEKRKLKYMIEWAKREARPALPSVVTWNNSYRMGRFHLENNVRVLDRLCAEYGVTCDDRWRFFADYGYIVTATQSKNTWVVRRLDAEDVRNFFDYYGYIPTATQSMLDVDKKKFVEGVQNLYDAVADIVSAPFIRPIQIVKAWTRNMELELPSDVVELIARLAVD